MLSGTRPTPGAPGAGRARSSAGGRDPGSGTCSHPAPGIRTDEPTAEGRADTQPRQMRALPKAFDQAKTKDWDTERARPKVVSPVETGEGLTKRAIVEDGRGRPRPGWTGTGGNASPTADDGEAPGADGGGSPGASDECAQLLDPITGAGADKAPGTDAGAIAVMNEGIITGVVATETTGVDDNGPPEADSGDLQLGVNGGGDSSDNERHQDDGAASPFVPRSPHNPTSPPTIGNEESTPPKQFYKTLLEMNDYCHVMIHSEVCGTFSIYVRDSQYTWSELCQHFIENSPMLLRFLVQLFPSERLKAYSLRFGAACGTIILPTWCSSNKGSVEDAYVDVNVFLRCSTKKGEETAAQELSPDECILSSCVLRGMISVEVHCEPVHGATPFLTTVEGARLLFCQEYTDFPGRIETSHFADGTNHKDILPGRCVNENLSKNEMFDKFTTKSAFRAGKHQIRGAREDKKRKREGRPSTNGKTEKDSIGCSPSDLARKLQPSNQPPPTTEETKVNAGGGRPRNQNTTARRKARSSKGTQKTNWDLHFQQLSDFRGKNGHFRAKRPSPLYNWISSQRRKYRESKLDDYQIEHLEKIGFAWQARKKEKKESQGNIADHLGEESSVAQAQETTRDAAENTDDDDEDQGHNPPNHVGEKKEAASQQQAGAVAARQCTNRTDLGDSQKKEKKGSRTNITSFAQVQEATGDAAAKTERDDSSISNGEGQERPPLEPVAKEAQRSAAAGAVGNNTNKIEFRGNVPIFKGRTPPSNPLASGAVHALAIVTDLTPSPAALAPPTGSPAWALIHTKAAIAPAQAPALVAKSGQGGDGKGGGNGDHNIKKQKPKRRQKDPNAPTQPKNAFMFYLDSVRAKIKEENPNISANDISKEASDRYKKISAAEKLDLVSKAAAAKEKYEQEMALYQLSKREETSVGKTGGEGSRQLTANVKKEAAVEGKQTPSEEEKREARNARSRARRAAMSEEEQEAKKAKERVYRRARRVAEPEEKRKARQASDRARQRACRESKAAKAKEKYKQERAQYELWKKEETESKKPTPREK